MNRRDKAIRDTGCDRKHAEAVAKAMEALGTYKGTALTLPWPVRQYMATKCADAAIEILGYET